ncbi:hypothetical protein N7535_004548 [Penicillium sp. DV-2018c]|nr:hypothetical protein N7535_004548 [Penicillium sp. DV-2018c]
MVVTSVQKLEPLHLRLEWMNDLAQAVAFLESLNLAHGDLRPENILLDRNRLKLSDFDCTDMIGANYEACMCPYGRLLNDKDEKSGQGPSGTSGFLGPRTEQFSLGSLYYLINYGFEVYGDRCLADDPYEHGPKTVDLLQDMVFPELNGDPMIDGVIDKCWHYGYVKIADLAAHTETLLDERSDALESNGGEKVKVIVVWINSAACLHNNTTTCCPPHLGAWQWRQAAELPYLARSRGPLGLITWPPGAGPFPPRLASSRGTHYGPPIPSPGSWPIPRASRRPAPLKTEGLLWAGRRDALPAPGGPPTVKRPRPPGAGHPHDISAACQLLGDHIRSSNSVPPVLDHSSRHLGGLPGAPSTICQLPGDHVRSSNPIPRELANF